jgi:transcriptional regulator with XRE-family HTH domain
MDDLKRNVIFAQNLQKHMDKRGITRKKLADDLDLNYNTISSWMKFESYPRMPKVEKLAEYFKINVSDLIEEPTTPLAMQRKKYTVEEIFGAQLGYAIEESTEEQKKMMKKLIQAVLENKAE